MSDYIDWMRRKEYNRKGIQIDLTCATSTGVVCGQDQGDNQQGDEGQLQQVAQITLLRLDISKYPSTSYSRLLQTINEQHQDHRSSCLSHSTLSRCLILLSLPTPPVKSNTSWNS